MKIKVNNGQMDGMQLGRRWDEIVKALIESGSIILYPKEKITEIKIDPEYGLMLKIDYTL